MAQAWAASMTPSDRNKRWSDAGFKPSDCNGFTPLPQPDFRGKHGIVFQDACWSLLEAVLDLAQLSLRRLFDVCNSLPVSQKCRAPTWGHGFGGAIVVDKIHHFPWEGRHELSESTLAKPHPVFRRNPYQVPGVDRLLDEDPQQPPAATQLARPPRALALDCFALLAEELCAAIAMLLPTADVLRACLASRAF